MNSRDVCMVLSLMTPFWQSQKSQIEQGFGGLNSQRSDGCRLWDCWRQRCQGHQAHVFPVLLCLLPEANFHSYRMTISSQKGCILPHLHPGVQRAFLSHRSMEYLEIHLNLHWLNSVASSNPTVPRTTACAHWL